LNQAITNIIDTDVVNTTPVHNPALTGALRRRANEKTSRLTAKAKHYHAKTTYTMNYTYITLYILSMLASLIYIAIRVYYIANGVMRQEIPSNTNVVDTATCIENNILIDSDKCTTKECAKESTACSNMLAGDLLTIGLNQEITPGLIQADEFKGIREIMATATYSWWWSLVVLAAEIGGFVLVHLSQQMFIRQDTKFYEMTPDRVQQLAKVRQ
jgi:hypothetical protein